MYVDEIIENKSNLLGVQVECNGELIFVNSRFYLKSHSNEDLKLSIPINEGNFTFLDYILIKKFSTTSLDRKVSVVGILHEEVDKSIFIDPQHLVLYAYNHDIYVFNEIIDLSEAFPYRLEYNSTFDKGELTINNKVTCQLEMTLIGFKLNGVMRFYLTEEKPYEIQEPYIVNLDNLIEITDTTFLENYTKIISFIVPSPTPWLNQVRLTVDIKKIENNTYIATNIENVYIRVSNTLYKHIK